MLMVTSQLSEKCRLKLNFLLCSFVYDVAMRTRGNGIHDIYFPGTRGNGIHDIYFPGARGLGIHEVLSS
jgi:hypothetical protein